MRSAPSTRRCASDGFAVEWLDQLPDPLAAAVPRRAPPPARRRRSLRRVGAAARGCTRPRREPSSSSSSPSTATRSRRSPPMPWSSPTDGLTDALLPELSGCRRPDAGAGARDRAAAGAASTSGPHYARRGFDYWQQLPDRRLVLGGRRDASLETEHTASRSDDAARSRSGSTRSRPSSSARRRGSPTAGPGSGDRPPTCCRWPAASRAATALWVAGGLLGPRKRARLRLRRTSSRGAISGDGAGRARALRPGALRPC